MTSPGIAGALCRTGHDRRVSASSVAHAQSTLPASLIYLGRPVRLDLGNLAVTAIEAAELDLVAGLAQAGEGPADDEFLQYLVRDVGREQHRPLALVALVDPCVDLLQHAVAALRGAQDVDLEELH